MEKTHQTGLGALTWERPDVPASHRSRVGDFTFATDNLARRFEEAEDAEREGRGNVPMFAVLLVSIVSVALLAVLGALAMEHYVAPLVDMLLERFL